MGLDREFEVTKKYAEAVRDVATKEGLPVVDVWNALYNAAGREERALGKFLSDGLHLNAAGYEVCLLMHLLSHLCLMRHGTRLCSMS